jgi:dephospho-CoA kinase
VNTRPALRVGLTGGIGSGKSTVASMLAQQGARVIDTDAISKNLTAPAGAAIPAIEQTFGADYITQQGALDRGRMRQLVFQNPAARVQLEQLLHPLIGEEARDQALSAQGAGSLCIVFDIPLLVESGRWRPIVDQVLVVDCLPETQIARVMARNQLPREDVESILKQQAPRTQRLRAADHVIDNNTADLEQLRVVVHSLATHFGL